MNGNEQWKADLKKVFESFKRTYIEDAKDEAKIDGEDEFEATADYERKTYEEFENYIFDYITEFFEENEGSYPK